MAEKTASDKDLFFDRPFSQRIKEGWEKFSQGEEKLREMIKNKANSDDITEYCSKLLSCAFSDVCFEVGFNGEKYDLILSPEKDKFMLFFFEAFKKQAPENILKHWDIILGRPAHKDMVLGINGKRISPDDVYVKVEKCENSILCNIIGYCEDLVSVLKNDENEALWILDLMLDKTVGEIVNMRYVNSIDMANKPFGEKENYIKLNALPEIMNDLFGEKEGWDTVESYLESCVGYQINPQKDQKEFVPRYDIYVGFSAFSPIVNCYYNNDLYYTEKAQSNGAVAGFIFYPLWCFEDDSDSKKSDKILDFRDELEVYISSKTNNTACCFLGGATGIHFGYLDFIAWDLKAVLSLAEEFFSSKDFIPFSCFQSFNSSADGIPIKHEI